MAEMADSELVIWALADQCRALRVQYRNMQFVLAALVKRSDGPVILTAADLEAAQPEHGYFLCSASEPEGGLILWVTDEPEPGDAG